MMVRGFPTYFTSIAKEEIRVPLRERWNEWRRIDRDLTCQTNEDLLEIRALAAIPTRAGSLPARSPQLAGRLLEAPKRIPSK